MRIKFTRPTALRLTVDAGDELVIGAVSPEIQTLLRSAGLDGQSFAHVVNEDGEDVADAPDGRELAVTGSGRRRRSATVS